MCNEIFLDEADVFEHCQSYHQIERLITDSISEKFTCKNCCLKFDTLEDMISHKTCDLCLASVKSEDLLIQHKKICKKPSSKESKKKRPELITNNIHPFTFPCCLCPTLFNDEPERLMHCESTHGFILATDIQLSLECPKCFFCDRTFPQLNAYYAHFEEPCHNKNRCKKCGRKFLCGEQLVQHDQNIHSSIVPPRYECLKCTISFQSSSAYYSHNHRYRTLNEPNIDVRFVLKNI